MEQSLPDAKVLQETVISGGRQIVCIVQRIVRNQVMMCILYLDAYRFFNQSIFFEIIRVHQGTKERTIGVFICICSVYPYTPPSLPLPGSGRAAELAIKKKLANVRLGLHHLPSVHLLIPEVASSYTNTFPLAISCGNSASVGRRREW